MRAGFTLAVVLLVCASASFGAVTQIPKMRKVSFEGWGVQVEVPLLSRRVPMAASGDVELWDLHVANEFVYFVQVVKVAPDTLTSTAIEQDIQAQSNAAAKRGETKRWEMDSAGGELFKGLNYYIKPSEDLPEAAVELDKMLRGRTGYVSAAWAPLQDDTGPMLIVGVIGPKGRDAEVDNYEKYFARMVTRTKPAIAPSTVPPAPVTLPKPHSAAPKIESKAETKPLPALKKGDIKIEGVVESIAVDKRCLTLKAQQITLFGADPVALDPPRNKVVNVAAPAVGIAAGDRVVVIGKNTGVGKPMTAAALSKAP